MHEARCGGQGLRRDRLRAIAPRLGARRSFFGRALLMAFALASATTAPASAADAAARPAPRAPGVAPLPRVTAPRLYVINCGTLVYNRPEDYNLTREEVADTNMSVPCYLVIHAKGILLFDTGLSDRLVGRPLYENVDGGYGQIKFNSLRGQLADIGVTPADISYLAISHSHFDHVGNANDYAGSTWLAQKAERDFMFGTKADRAYVPLYAALAKTGGVVISGDLYHYTEERTLHRMPNEEKSTATPSSRELIERFLKEKNAQLWIGHSTAFFKNAIKWPGWYD